MEWLAPHFLFKETGSHNPRLHVDSSLWKNKILTIPVKKQDKEKEEYLARSPHL